MKACVYSDYGPPEVVSIADIPTPEPKADEVLVKIYATTVSTADWRIRSGVFPRGFGTIARLIYGWSKPRKQVLGTEFSGEIVKLGKSVTQFKVGDFVIGFSAGLGAHAEFKTMKANAALVHKPATMSFEDAAALCFGGTTALNFLVNIGRLQAGEKVLVIGAGGAVGSAAVQLAKLFGAEVTAVCSASKASKMKELGALRVIDYKTEDFTKGQETFDVILDTIGNTTFRNCSAVLTDTGRLLMVAAGADDFLSMILTAIKGGKKAIGGATLEKAEDLQKLVEFYERGVYRPLIDSVFPMSQIVDAHRRVDSGHKTGSVVVKVIS